MPGHIGWGIEESTNIDIMSIIGDVIFHKSFVTSFFSEMNIPRRGPFPQVSVSVGGVGANGSSG